MRVSSAGWLYDDLLTTRRIARLTAAVSHDHPEGIKGAEAIASAIFLARTGSTKEQIRDYIVSEFGYDLSRTCDEIRPTYHHIETCQQTVPEAVTAFLEGTDVTDALETLLKYFGIRGKDIPPRDRIEGLCPRQPGARRMQAGGDPGAAGEAEMVRSGSPAMCG